MNILAQEARASKLEFTEYSFIVYLQDGRTLSIPKTWFPTLDKASTEQLQSYEISGGGIGIHWEILDEDIHVPSLLLGIKSNQVDNMIHSEDSITKAI